MDYISIQKTTRIATITLTREEKRNAFDDKLVEELKQALASLKNDQSVKILVLTGKGSVFSAGADLAYLKKLQKFSYQMNLNDSNSLMQLYREIYNFPKITIAKVNGHAIAGGAGLATVCDFVYAVPQAKIGYTEVRIGFVPAIVSTYLIDKIGLTKAKELLLTGHLIDARQAQQIGLINKVVEPEKMDSEIEKLTDMLLNNVSGQSIQATKSLLNQIIHLNPNEAFAMAAKANALSRSNDDCKRGISAFLNKEKISW